MNTVQLLKISEAATALGVSLETLRRWEKLGKIRATRTPGGTRLYSSAEINRLLKDKKQNEVFVATKTSAVSKRTLYRWAKKGDIPTAKQEYLSSVVNEQIHLSFNLSQPIKLKLGIITVVLLSLISFYPLLNTKMITNLFNNGFSETASLYIKNNSNISEKQVATTDVNSEQSHLVQSKQLDKRALILKDYLAQFNSPLQYHTQDLVDAADAYNMDWKLIASIAGAESTFGKKIPYSSYNGWGWGIYGTRVTYFTSWRDALFNVSRGLKNGYMDKGLTNPYAMNSKYSSSPYWGDSVSYFLQDLEQFSKKYDFKYNSQASSELNLTNS